MAEFPACVGGGGGVAHMRLQRVRSKATPCVQCRHRCTSLLIVVRISMYPLMAWLAMVRRIVLRDLSERGGRDRKVGTEGGARVD